ncbi:unnamed protein product [Caenorhabditis angaria]|uniref:Transthyretin-like family protein n=1 Tax=Caenorhabditis angaria TaxID=860376 RepID=A0A9P1IDG9_9PELO|nr:unnamed protein product [Caenorhabditis angaria]
MWHYSVFYSLVVFFAKDDENVVENASIYGKITCDGKPVEGVRITMLDDNAWIFDHILDVFETNKLGKYRLHGTPHDQNLDLLLIIEHSCHQNKNIKTGQIVDSYSEFRIPREVLEEKNFDLKFNVELGRNQKICNSVPGLFLWKTAANIRTKIAENAEDLKIWMSET